MAEATPIPATVDAYKQVRGNVLDRAWAHHVAWALLMRDVEDDLVVEGLREALDLVRETGESPEDLYGPASEHASELFRRWRSEGRLRLTREGVPTARSVPASSLKTGSWFALIMFVLALIDGTELSAGALALPVLLGFATVGGLALWEWISRRWATPVAVTAVATLTVAAATAITLVIEVTSSTSLGSFGPWLLVAEGAVLWLAGSATLVLVTAKAYASTRDAPDDEAWAQRFAGILRGPGWWSDARVREIVAEARSHAAESGRTLAEEFGTPQDYASQYGVDVGRRTKLRITFFAALACLSLVLLVDGFSWAASALTIIFGWKAWREHRKHDKHRRYRAPEDQRIA